MKEIFSFNPRSDMKHLRDIMNENTYIHPSERERERAHHPQSFINKQFSYLKDLLSQ